MCIFKREAKPLPSARPTPIAGIPIKNYWNSRFLQPFEHSKDTISENKLYYPHCFKGTLIYRKE